MALSSELSFVERQQIQQWVAAHGTPQQVALPSATVSELASEMRVAKLWHCSASSAAGTTILISPQSAAVTAEIISPVSNIWSARLRPTARLRATIGVVQKSPILTPGVANAAWSEATAKSQVATNWHPAAVAMPCTSAITG